MYLQTTPEIIADEDSASPNIIPAIIFSPSIAVVPNRVTYELKNTVEHINISITKMNLSCFVDVTNVADSLLKLDVLRSYGLSL